MTTSPKRPRQPGLRPPDQVPAAEFKARCLELMDAVKLRRTSYIITKHGKPVAKLVPTGNAPPSPIGALAGSLVRGADQLVGPHHAAWRSGRDPLDRPV